MIKVQALIMSHLISDTREGHSVYQYAQSHPCSSDDGGYPDRGFNNQEQPDPDCKFVILRMHDKDYSTIF